MVYHYKNYLKVIKGMIEKNKLQRGYQTALAKAAKCQTSFFSNVLNEKAHLNQEHAARLSQFWSFDDGETRYFVELVNYARTDDLLLKNILAKKIDEYSKEAKKLKNILEAVTPSLSEKDMNDYYATWYMSAVHILIGIQSMQTAQALALHLMIPVETVQQALNHLSRMGLIKFSKKNGWVRDRKHIHLPNESSLSSYNHRNWRDRAVFDSKQRPRIGTHFTSIQTHSTKDYEEIQKVLVHAIKSTRKIVEPSPIEVASCICVDYFMI